MRILALLFIPLVSCTYSVEVKPEKKETAAAILPTVITKPPFEFDYEKQKQRCKEIYSAYSLHRNDSNERTLTSFIADSLLPCWYGTPWDFYGTTQQPQTGKIACGYFVTTILRDGGYNINRVKMAQCASQQLVNATCTNISNYSRKSIDHFVEEVKKKGEGLFIVGLDYHTGFILHDATGVYFIHSGFYEPKCALKEPALESKTLRNSNYRTIGKIRF